MTERFNPANESQRCLDYHELMLHLPVLIKNTETANFADRQMARLLLKRVHTIHLHECVEEYKVAHNK